MISFNADGERAPLAILVFDASPVYCSGIASVLSAELPDAIVSMCPDSEVAWNRCAGAAGLTVLVMDLDLPFGEAFELLKRLERGRSEVKTLIMCESIDSPLLAEAIAAGADGLFLKSSTADELVQAVGLVAEGADYLSPKIQLRLAAALPPAGSLSLLTVLTRRERSVSLRLVEGHTPREISEELGVSIKTVDAQRLTALKKLGIRNVADLTRLAVAQGFARLD